METQTRAALESFHKDAAEISGLTGSTALQLLLRGINLLRCPVCHHLSMKRIMPENVFQHPT
ncbi:MAG: hypothetical protein FJY10_10675 [Bacteroidetes bacterium]|nr:hypothetical protein [Bacteroidota bacterium]